VLDRWLKSKLPPKLSFFLIRGNFFQTQEIGLFFICRTKPYIFYWIMTQKNELEVGNPLSKMGQISYSELLTILDGGLPTKGSFCPNDFSTNFENFGAYHATCCIFWNIPTFSISIGFCGDMTIRTRITLFLGQILILHGFEGCLFYVHLTKNIRNPSVNSILSVDSLMLTSGWVNFFHWENIRMSNGVGSVIVIIMLKIVNVIMIMNVNLKVFLRGQRAKRGKIVCFSCNRYPEPLPYEPYTIRGLFILAICYLLSVNYIS